MWDGAGSTVNCLAPHKLAIQPMQRSPELAHVRTMAMTLAQTEPVEWVTEQELPVQDVVSDPPRPTEVTTALGKHHRKAAEWKHAWALLRKKEALALADVASSITSCGLQPHDLVLQDPPRPSSASAQDSSQRLVPCTLAQLRRRAWDQVHAVREAVARVQEQLSTAQPGATFVVGLTTDIQTVDQLLNTFHQWNSHAMLELDKQASQLELEVAASVLRLEEDLDTGVDAGLTTSPRGPVVAAGAGGDGNSRVIDQGRRGLQRPAGVRSGRPASGAPHRRVSQDAFQDRDQDLGGTMRRTTQSSHSSSQPSSRLASHQRGGLAPEVVEFEEFMSRHGEYGGWEREDHEAFEEILKACGGDYAQAVKVALEQCVGFTKAEIVKHATWHMDYMDLLVRKRMAVAAWRAKKDIVKAQTQARAALLVPEPSLAPAAQANAERGAASAAAAQAAREAAAKKHLVMSWKARKEEAVRAAAERAAEAARQAAERAAIEQAERQHMNKLKLEVFKEIKEKQALEAARWAAHAAEEQQAAKALSTNQVEAVAQRNQATWTRRQELMEQKRQEAARRSLVQQQLLQQVHVEAPSDPNRVLKGTQAHMARLQQVREEQRKPRDSDFILHVSHRQTPSWRAGLSGV